VTENKSAMGNDSVTHYHQRILNDSLLHILITLQLWNYQNGGKKNYHRTKTFKPEFCTNDKKYVLTIIIEW